MANEDITLSSVLTSGKTYVVTFTISAISGTVTPILGTQAGTGQTATGTFIDHIVANGTDFIFRISDGDSVTITAWSCIEYDKYQLGPRVMLSWSDDGGHNWSNEHIRDLGDTGEFAKRVIWRRLGSSRDRIFKIKISDPIKKVMIAGYIDAQAGSH